MAIQVEVFIDDECVVPRRADRSFVQDSVIADLWEEFRSRLGLAAGPAPSKAVAGRLRTVVQTHGEEFARFAIVGMCSDDWWAGRAHPSRYKDDKPVMLASIARCFKDEERALCWAAEGREILDNERLDDLYRKRSLMAIEAENAQLPLLDKYREAPREPWTDVDQKRWAPGLTPLTRPDFAVVINGCRFPAWDTEAQPELKAAIWGLSWLIAWHQVGLDPRFRVPECRDLLIAHQRQKALDFQRDLRAIDVEIAKQPTAEDLALIALNYPD